MVSGVGSLNDVFLMYFRIYIRTMYNRRQWNCIEVVLLMIYRFTPADLKFRLDKESRKED